MRATLRGAALALLLGLPAWAPAQLGGSVVAETDDRSRGRSLSGEQPVLRLTLSYDADGGAYAGVSLSQARFDGGPRRPSLLAYAGFGGPLAAGLRWDLGATTTHAAGESRYDDAEAYAGLTGARWGLRLYLAPDHYGSGVRTGYAELDLTQPLAGRWRALGHLGALRRADGRDGLRVDARAGVAFDGGAVDWQLAGVAVRRGGPFPVPDGEHRLRLVGSVAWAF